MTEEQKTVSPKKRLLKGIIWLVAIFAVLVFLTEGKTIAPFLYSRF